MAHPPPRSFLLRLWREQADAPLRATLITVTQPQEQHHFLSLEALHAFLRAQEDEATQTNRDWNAIHCIPLQGS